MMSLEIFFVSIFLLGTIQLVKGLQHLHDPNPCLVAPDVYGPYRNYKSSNDIAHVELSNLKESLIHSECLIFPISGNEGT